MTKVQLPSHFLEDFVQTAQKAKKRIYLQSMLFESGKILNKLEPVLIKKVQEGVDVRINKDWVSQRYIHQDPNIIPAINNTGRQYGNELHTKNQLLIQKWSKAGIKITETNIPGLFSSLLSISGRNHIKMYLVDDKAAWIGGVNLGDMELEWIDLMVKFTDCQLIETLAKQFHLINEHKPKDNYSIKLASGNELLIDAGIRGRSLIYNEAVRMITTAKNSIIFVSQFVPDGKLLKNILVAAQKGLKITIYTANKDYRNFTTLPFNLPYLYFVSKIKGHKNITLNHQLTNVHAKLMLIDDKSAIFGSHNLVQIGVLLATEEIAIKTGDPDLIKELFQFIKTQTITSKIP